MFRSLFDFFQRIFLASRGRPMALAILVWLLLADLASQAEGSDNEPPNALHGAVSFFGAPFRSGRDALFDGFQKLYPRQPQSAPVTIVAIDEASLRQFGQWPWPRNRTAALIDAIAAHQPAAIGLDMYMPEEDATSPAKTAGNLPAGNDALATALRQLPSHDAQMATALRNGPTVLGAAGFGFKALSTRDGLRTVPVAVQGSHDPLPHLRNYPWVLASLPELQAAATGQAVLTVELQGGLVRRLPMVVAVSGQVVPGLAMEMLRVGTGSAAITVTTDAHGVAQVAVSEVTVPTQANGEIWLHFANARSGAARYLSAATLLAGKADPDLLAGKLVLLGLTGAGLSDQRTTALGELVPGIEIQAQAIEALFDGRMLLRPWWMKWLEVLLAGMVGGLLIWRMPRAAANPGGALKAQPIAAKWLTLALNLFITAAGFGAFVTSGLLFDASAVFIVLSSVVGSLLASGFIEVNLRNETMAQEQQRMREQEALAAGERSAAWRIQLGSLPTAELLANEDRVDIATLLKPAKDVGGDLFDFFMIDQHRLGFVIGDVSGKGLPASIFMAVTQTLTRAIAKHVNAGPTIVAQLASAELDRMNPETLFVTMLLGVLDLESGLLTLVNAGHDGPWLSRKDGTLEHLDSPASAGGPPLCMVDDYPYAAQQAHLAPGDALVMYTDGITEAMNAAQEIYSAARLAHALQDADKLTAQEVVAHVQADVARHVGGVEPSDDMALLVIRWTPPEVNAR
jgi:serine phosphatase RsbU (regulator of sigma subunit)/CHASE2 domain-containing sensor protein